MFDEKLVLLFFVIKLLYIFFLSFEVLIFDDCLRYEDSFVFFEFNIWEEIK